MAKEKLDEWFEPQLPVSGTEKDLGRTGYMAELKHDGRRCVVERTVENGFRIYGRRGLLYNDILPELNEQLSKIPMLFRLDGEIVYIDGEGHEIFAGSQKRCQISNPEKVEQYRKVYPVGIFLFDIIMLNKIDFVLAQIPYFRRKTILKSFYDLNINLYNLNNVRLVMPSLKLKETYQWAIENGYEGVVLKKVDAPYVNGENNNWIKVKSREHSPFILKDNGMLE